MTAREESGDARPARDGSRRKIAWDAFNASALDEAARARVGATWRARMQQEHLAVGAFSILATELAAEGCDPVVLALITKAASDEVRHSEICRRFAVALLGEEAVPARVRGLPKIPRHPEASRAARSLLHVVDMCCLSETLTGVYLTEMLARAVEPVARAAIESLLEDEIDHGRVGWAYLATRSREGRLEGLADGLPAMLDRNVGRVIERAKRAPEAGDPSLSAIGYLGNDEGAALFARALRDVVLPGFEGLGVDLGPAHARIAERGWLAR